MTDNNCSRQNEKRNVRLRKKVNLEKVQRYMRYLFITMTTAAIVYNIIHHLWEALLISFLTLVLFLLPTIYAKKAKIHIPSSFQIIILLFIFASMYLGEIRGYFHRYRWWDDVLHGAAGIILGYLGFLLIYMMNKDRNIHLKLSPFFIAFFAFCFAMTIGVIWEIFEFAVDEFLGYNMQKARNLEEIYGTFDTRLGLLDTMHDLIQNTIGAAIVSVVGYYYCKKKMVKNNTFWKLRDEFIDKNPDIFK